MADDKVEMNELDGKVLSVTLDEWSSDEIDAMIEVGGNSSANSIYETYFPKGYTKPGLDASHEQRAKFIRPLS
ncbi:ADP-ribosylation factor GTPase-activating protein AGD12 [Glycine max]|nr:ADP-ribosylation factor GTPase-activating protein AGD12 [Glycine max]